MYEPKVDLSSVVLPAKLKDTITEAVVYFVSLLAMRRTVLQSCSLAVLQSGSPAVLQSHIHTVIQSYSRTVVQSYSRTVIL